MTSFASAPDDPRKAGAGLPVEELAERFLERLRRGEKPSVTEYVEAYPHLADDIQAIFPTLAMLDDFAPRLESASPRLLPTDLPPQLGEYRIIREIGRGGMGVVYEAEHTTMRRRVALKVLAPHVAAHRASLDRFLRETRVAGRLHHTNIVPVFEFGTASGIHFYAMQFIHGQNLDLIIEELKRLRNRSAVVASAETTLAAPTPDSSWSRTIAGGLLAGGLEPRGSLEGPSSADAPPSDPLGGVRDRAAPGSLSASESGATSRIIAASTINESSGLTADFFHRAARVALQVAEALSYAHAHGVLHRDIKPSNLILDTEGVVWVTDFGLAKHENENVTLTGDIVGTLRYMAPERFHGITDARSDVFGLGLTLYELCTLTPAFDQSERGRLIRQVSEGEPVRPRALEPGIPRDLETVILKSLQRDPQRRYSSAEAMAEDLRRFLSDRPILARRVSRTERAVRWCRRNPASAALLGSTALLLMVLVASALAFAWHARDTAERLAKAHQAATQRLYASHFDRAQAGRWSGRPGQHFASLAALRQAAAILPSLNLSPSQIEHERRILRNEAVASLPLVDLGGTVQWDVEPPWTPTVAFDDSYARYAQSDLAGRVVVRDARSRELLVELPTMEQRAWTIMFSPDGRYLACKYHHGPPYTSDPILRVWDLVTRQAVVMIDKDLVYAPFLFRADGTRFVVGLQTGSIQQYELPSGKLVQEKTFDIQPVALAHHDQRPQLAIAFDGRPVVTIWDYEREDLRQVEAGEPISALAWSGKRGRLVGGTASEGDLYLWNTEYPEMEPVRLTGHAGRVTRLAFANDGTLLASQAWDSTVRLWDLTLEQQLLRIDGITLTFSGFSSDGRRLAFVGRDNFGIWQVARQSPVRYLRHDPRLTMRWSVQFHPHHPWLLATGTGKGLELWDAERGELLAEREMGVTRSVHFTPDGNQLICGAESDVTRWTLIVDNEDSEVREVRVTDPVTLAPGKPFRVDLDATGEYLAMQDNYSQAHIRALHDPAQEPKILYGHHQLDRVLLSPGARWAVTATWNGVGIRAWDTKEGGFVELEPEVSSATPVFSRDGRWLITTTGEHQTLWEVGTWKKRHHWKRERADGWPGPAAFSRDGKMMALPWTRFVAQLVDVETGARLAILEPPRLVSLSAYDFSANDRYLAISESKCIQIWDLRALRSELGGMQLDW